MSDEKLNKIAKVLDATTEELKGYINEPIKMKCLNEACHLNLDKMCDNPVVLEGRAPCEGKDIKKKKHTKFKYSDFGYLFAKIE